MKHFKCHFTVEVEIAVADHVIAEVLLPDWSKNFYDLRTPQEVAEHIAYNVVANGVKDLTTLDGFAHFSKDDMRFDEPKVEVEST